MHTPAQPVQPAGLTGLPRTGGGDGTRQQWGSNGPATPFLPILFALMMLVLGVILRKGGALLT